VKVVNQSMIAVHMIVGARMRTKESPNLSIPSFRDFGANLGDSLCSRRMLLHLPLLSRTFQISRLRNSFRVSVIEHNISEVTRRNIIDNLRVGGTNLYGRLSEIEFLSRVFDLTKLPSHDGRFHHMEDDIRQHTVNNSDWENEWIWSDGRLNLLHGPDDIFLRFLCELVHPVVRTDNEQVDKLVDMLNIYLKEDGWELTERMRLSGRPVFAAHRRLDGMTPALGAAKVMADSLSSDYISQQITRMEVAVENDPELAIGTAKELIESVCKTILKEEGIQPDSKTDLPALVSQTIDILGLFPPAGATTKMEGESLRIAVKALVTLTHRIAEVRNAYGTGHGKEADTTPIEPRYARLCVGAAATIVVFLFESHLHHKSS